MKKRALLCLALLLAVLLPINQVAAQQDQHCFAETGLCISDGQNRRTLVHDTSGYLSSPAWSPDGKQVVRDFVSGQETNIAYGQGEIRWSPDSKLLAFREDRRTDRVGLVRSLTGGSQVTTLPSSETPVWLP